MYLEDDLSVFAVDEKKKWRAGHPFNDRSRQRRGPLRATEKQTLDRPLTEWKIVLEQKHDKYCQTAELHVGQPESKLSIGNGELLV